MHARLCLFIYLWVVVILIIAHTHIVVCFFCFFFFGPLPHPGRYCEYFFIAESLRSSEMAEWVGWKFPRLSVEVSYQELGQRGDQVFY